MCQIINCYNPQPDKRVLNGTCTTGGTAIKDKKNRRKANYILTN